MIAYHGKNASRREPGAGGRVGSKRALGFGSTKATNVSLLLLIMACGGLHLNLGVKDTFLLGWQDQDL